RHLRAARGGEHLLLDGARERPRIASRLVTGQLETEPGRRPGGARPGVGGGERVPVGESGRIAIARSFAGPCGRGDMRVGPGGGERALEGAKDEVVDLAAVTEANFELLRVGIDVDEARSERELEGVRRVRPVVEHVAGGESGGG